MPFNQRSNLSVFKLQGKEAGIRTLVALDDQGGEFTEYVLTLFVF